MGINFTNIKVNDMAKNDNIDKKFQNPDESVNWAKTIGFIIAVGLIGGVIYAIVSNLVS